MKLSKLIMIILAFSLVLTSQAFAGADGFNYILTAGGASTDTNSPAASVEFTMDSSAGTDVQGWSFSVCNDAAFATVTNVADGSTTLGLLGGDGPDFNTISTFADGWNVGLVIGLASGSILAPGSGFQLNVVDYDILAGPAEGATETSDLCFCDTLGSPPVTTVVVVNGESLFPIQNCGTLSISGVPAIPEFTFTHDAYAGAELAGVFSHSATILANIEDTNGVLDDTQGFSFGVTVDSATTVVTAVLPSSELAVLVFGEGPHFFSANLHPDGWTLGVVYGGGGSVFMQFDGPTAVVAADYDFFLDGATPLTTSFGWSNDLGSPPVVNAVVAGGNSIPPALIEQLNIVIDVIFAVPYIRGDCNDDGLVNLADGVFLLSQLFQGGPSAGCDAACDANDDGLIDQSDAIYILNYRFLNGAAPASPFSDCGGDGSINCVFSSC